MDLKEKYQHALNILNSPAGKIAQRNAKIIKNLGLKNIKGLNIDIPRYSILNSKFKIRTAFDNIKYNNWEVKPVIPTEPIDDETEYKFISPTTIENLYAQERHDDIIKQLVKANTDTAVWSKKSIRIAYISILISILVSVFSKDIRDTIIGKDNNTDGTQIQYSKYKGIY